MAVVSFTVLGEPMGKQRPHPYSTPNGAREFTPHKTVKYENLVRLEYRAQCSDYYFEEGTTLYIMIDCFLAAPKSGGKKKLALRLKHILRPTKKPDWDNAGKIVCDSLNGIAYKDDSQIVDGRVRKWWSKRPRVVVTLSDSEINMANYHVNEEQEEETNA